MAAHQNTKRICPISNSAQSEDTTFTLSVQLQALKEEADNWHANSRRSFQQTLLEQTRAFIGHVKSLLSEDGVLRTKADNKFNEVEKVWVGTIHKAKGRQFEAVVVPCATDKVFGSYPQAFKAHDDGRQLLYVAASRAEKHLCFTYQGAYNLETQRQRMTPLLTSSAASPFTQLKQHPLTLKDEIVETILG